LRTVCFGEIMLRLSPPGFGRFEQAASFDAYYGGAEANVAVALAELGTESAYVTRLPGHAIGEAAICELRRWGVDTRFIARGGERLGIYFCERGASDRPPKVIYDRAGSAFALSQSGDYDWDTILEGAGWFHFTGITPALGENIAKICSDAVAAAKQRGITVSCDVNYRRALWPADKAGAVLAELLSQTDVCIINEEHAGLLFSIKAEKPGGGDAISFDSAAYVAGQVAQRFGCSKVAVTIRRTISASENRFAAVLYDRDTNCACSSRIYELLIVDRVGGGDAFSAGLIWSLQKDIPCGDTVEFAAVEFAAAACALKHTIEGDMNHVSESEVRTLAFGSGRSER
jgi:2-dehydro-3-deoxygluconokinase